jgi:hypothetical protein
MIVSVSRRCDIPRFQFKWFMERLDAGFVEVANPFNANQIKRVSLLAQKDGEDGVEAFVFWTRYPGDILANADELTRRGFPFYVMVTITGYPPELEPDMIHTEKALNAMKELSRKIGPDRVIWRYDPVLLTSITDEDFHRRNFDVLAQSLTDSVRRVIISIYDEYRGSKQRLEGREKAGELRMLDAGTQLADLFTSFAKSAGAAGMEIQSCAEKEDFSPFGIKPGACIDAHLIKKLWNLESAGKDKNQRPHCLCCKSVDIGCYGTCAAHCVYCYAW